MNHTLAILLEPSKKFKRFAVVEIDLKFKTKTNDVVTQHYGIRDRETGSIEDVVQAESFVEVPPIYDFFQQMKRLATFGIMFSSATNKFAVTGFRFGRATRVAVPVFEAGNVVDQKFVTTTKHINITADTFEECAIKLFRICVSGKLYGYYFQGRMERLYWDTEFHKFETETVDRKSIAIK